MHLGPFEGGKWSDSVSLRIYLGSIGLVSACYNREFCSFVQCFFAFEGRKSLPSFVLLFSY